MEVERHGGFAGAGAGAGAGAEVLPPTINRLAGAGGL